MQRVNSFESLRGVLTLLILVYHFISVFYPQKITYFKGGFLAVEVFFVLSGFLIIKMLISGKYDLFTFLWRRFLRLYPSLIFITISSYLIVLYHNYEIFSYSFEEVIYGVLSVYNYFLVFFEIPYFDRFEKEMLFLPLWSLSIEIQLYIISAFITYLITDRKILNCIFLILISLSCVLSYVYFNQLNVNPNEIYFKTEVRGSAFLIGGLIALNEDKLRGIFLKMNFILKEIIFLVTGIILGSMFVYIDIYRDWFFPFGFLIVDCLSGILILTLLQKENHSSLLYRLGAMSYPLFLCHYPVFIISKYSYSEPYIPLISFFLVFVLSFCIHKLIEEPFRNLYRKIYLVHEELILRLITASIIIILLSIIVNFKEDELLMTNVKQQNPFDLVIEEVNRTKHDEQSENVDTSIKELEKELNDYYVEMEKKLFLIKTETPHIVERDLKHYQSHTVYRCKAFLLGDSVMLGAAQKITSTYKGIIIDARVNRSFFEGLEVVQKNIDTIKGCENIVVHLGNNGYPRKGLLEQLINFLKENTNNSINIFFVNLKGSRLSWESSYNNNLYSLQENNKIKIIDWYSTAKEDVLYKDGIHLNNKGIKIYTQMIADALNLNLKSESLIESKVIKHTNPQGLNTNMNNNIQKITIEDQNINMKIQNDDNITLDRINN